VLYEVPWKGKNGSEIEAFVTSVEDGIGKEFQKDDVGKLLLCADADRLISSLVLVDKLTSLSRRYSPDGRKIRNRD
jgi:hypothetical protein